MRARRFAEALCATTDRECPVFIHKRATVLAVLNEARTLAAWPYDLTTHAGLNYDHSTLLQRWHLTRGGEVPSVPINSHVCANDCDVLH